MRFYDCDDDQQSAELTVRVSEEGLVGKNMLQAFAPDTRTEAVNRGYRPAGVADGA